jgi:hypothetical protein
MTEAELQTEITTLAESLGLVVLHVRDVRREDRGWTGFPDVFIVGAAGVLFRELKPSGGQLRGRQKAWQWRLREAGQDAGEWRSADWNDGTIAAELAALSGQNTQVGDEPDPVRAFYRALYGNRR